MHCSFIHGRYYYHSYYQAFSCLLSSLFMPPFHAYYQAFSCLLSSLFMPPFHAYYQAFSCLLSSLFMPIIMPPFHAYYQAFSCPLFMHHLLARVIMTLANMYTMYTRRAVTTRILQGSQCSSGDTQHNRVAFL